MIVATLPDPTVRPPSRYFNSVFYGIFYAFYYENQHKIAVFIWCIFICIISWHQKQHIPYQPYLHGASTM